MSNASLQLKMECLRKSRKSPCQEPAFEHAIEFGISSPAVCEIAKQYEYEGNLYVYGPVLVPDSVDRQGDVVSADDIRKCVRKFMDYQQAGERHQSMIPRSGVKLTQNFIAPVDFVESGKKISKGSWVVEFSVIDPVLRQKIMSGEYRSFSIGGKAKSSPVN